LQGYITAVVGNMQLSECQQTTLQTNSTRNLIVSHSLVTN